MTDVAINGIASWFGAGLGGGIGAGAIFYALRWFLEWSGGRYDKRQEVIDAGMKQLIEGLQHRVEALEKDLADTRRELRETRNELNECERRHSQSEGEILRLKAVLQGQGETRQRVAEIVAIDRLSGELK